MQGALEAVLPALAAGCPSLERLKLRLSAPSANEILDVRLSPAPGAEALPALKALHIDGSDAVLVALSLPMPALESITVRNSHGGDDPESTAPAVALGFPRAAPGAVHSAPAPPFPALTHLDLVSSDVSYDAAATPALRELALLATSTRVQVGGPALGLAAHAWAILLHGVFRQPLASQIGSTGRPAEGLGCQRKRRQHAHNMRQHRA